ncbi:MAG: hypothetical protein ACQEQV_03625 [Fibrobacterota bacterium]
MGNILFRKYFHFIMSKKMLISINFIVISLIAFFYAVFLAQKMYLSEVTFIPSMKYSSTPASIESIGLNLSSGTSGIDPYQIMEVFNTRLIKRKIIDEFGLIEKYGLEESDNKYVLAENQLADELNLSANEMGTFTVNKILSYDLRALSTTPDSAYEIVSRAYSLLDSVVYDFEKKPLIDELSFLEDVINKNRSKYDSTVREFNSFIRKNNMYQPQQISETRIEEIASLESRMTVNRIEINRMRQYKSRFSSDIQSLKEKNRLLKNELNSLRTNAVNSVFPPLDTMPDLTSKYMRLKTDVTVVENILKYLTSQYEDVSVKLNKNNSGLYVLDPAVVPLYKHKPKRSLLIIAIVGVYMMILLLLLSILFLFKKNE